jgi:hypothetical protein
MVSGSSISTTRSPSTTPIALRPAEEYLQMRISVPSWSYGVGQAGAGHPEDLFECGAVLSARSWSATAVGGTEGDVAVRPDEHGGQLPGEVR